MATVAFLRGVNVGGHRAFRPSVLARSLADLDAVNLGAAGTLIVRRPVRHAVLRERILEALPFPTEVLLCRASDVLQLVRSRPFADLSGVPAGDCSVGVLARVPRVRPDFPLRLPEGDSWVLEILSRRGRFVCSRSRRRGGRMIYPNEAFTRLFGVATTRNWRTFQKIAGLLEA